MLGYALFSSTVGSMYQSLKEPLEILGALIRYGAIPDKNVKIQTHAGHNGKHCTVATSRRWFQGLS